MHVIGFGWAPIPSSAKAQSETQSRLLISARADTTHQFVPSACGSYWILRTNGDIFVHICPQDALDVSLTLTLIVTVVGLFSPTGAVRVGLVIAAVISWGISVFETGQPASLDFTIPNCANSSPPNCSSFPPFPPQQASAYISFGNGQALYMATSNQCETGYTSWRNTCGNPQSTRWGVASATGLLQVAARGTDGSLQTIRQVSAGSNWSGWSSLGCCISDTPYLNYSMANGATSMFATIGSALYAFQTGAYGDTTWGPANYVNSSYVWNAAVINDAAGDISAVARTNSGSYDYYYSAAASGAWYSIPLGGPSGGFSNSPVAITNTDGRVEVFGVDSSGNVLHAWEGTPGGAWAPWASLGCCASLSGVSILSVARNGDGRLELFAVNSSGFMMHNWQTAPSGGWSGWNSLGGSYTTAPTAYYNWDGRLEYFVTDSIGQVWHGWQTSAGGGWQPAGILGCCVAQGTVAVEMNADGRLELFAVNPSGSMVHIWQISAGSGWSGFGPLGAGSFQVP